MRPAIFIACSLDNGMPVARALVRQLREHALDATIWNEDVFPPGLTSIDALHRQLECSDFAITVFTPDDIVQSKGVTVLAPRDNVVFELGLFLGRLGRDRVFVVRPQNPNLKSFSDFAGVVFVEYDNTRFADNQMAALSPAATIIAQAIKHRTSAAALLQSLQETAPLRTRADIWKHYNGHENLLARYFLRHYVDHYSKEVKAACAGTLRLPSSSRMQAAIEAISDAERLVLAISMIETDTWQHRGSPYVQANIRLSQEPTRRDVDFRRIVMLRRRGAKLTEEQVSVLRDYTAAGSNMQLRFGYETELSAWQTEHHPFRGRELANVLIVDDRVMTRARTRADHDGRLILIRETIEEGREFFEALWRRLGSDDQDALRMHLLMQGAGST
jgi:hypothetical protein